MTATLTKPPTEDSPSRHTTRARGTSLKLQQRYGYLFIAVPLLLFLVFAVIPVVMALVMSFTDYSVIGTTTWVGGANFAALIDDPYFWLSLKNTAIYTALFVPLGLTVALGTALIINRRIRAVKLFRTFFYIPVVCSSVAAATIWYWLLNPDFGLINIALGWIGIDGPAWLYSSRWAMVAIVIMSAWATFGTNMMIFLGGLQGISRDLLEAARIDGANVLQRFWHVTIPQLQRTMFLVTTLLIIGAFQVFDQAFVLTKGGPGNSTLTLVYYIYNEGFGRLRMGYASSMSFVLFLIIIVFSLVNARITNKAQD
ncbi:carbohydrate ABC transporter membrane protein 1, CUT1 family [Sanguibacter gelidistatuariae]|uniref:Carbohydrate ABC transporter membrane protein 1, CUT1 family n=1 Tax=Sanguibacter gelidistatuariae TaxID=1814289 RepID=A0A1G6KMZ2_9MICO|nr:sugar ABC transporter permease [Sanguibacter gelidistatuariae]SDC32344.1 carbohydrate ABC transporter membrane protein 1, CUT1 family [Sanguibacter gelidistatuariae]